MSNLTEDILAGVDIVDVVSRYVQIKKSGANFMGLCPFHNEKTPSFTVSADKQIFKCFGCGAWGNAITFLIDVEKIEFWDAIKILAKDANIDINKYITKNKISDKQINEKEKIKSINTHAKNFFKKQLQSNQKVKEYAFEQRQLTEDVLEKFEIWYAPGNFYELVNFLKNKWYSSNDIIKSSLAKKTSTGEDYSFFRNRLMFPIYDHIWNLVAFAGRVLDPNDNPKYLNISETPVYDKSKVLYEHCQK